MNKKIKQKKQEKLGMKKGHKDIWKNREHPRGMLRKKASEETKRKMSEEKKRWHKENEGNKMYKEKNKKISKKLMGRKLNYVVWNKGRHDLPKHTEEHKRKIALTGIGRKHSEESRKKMSKNRKGKNIGKIPWNKGKINIYSIETINKIREARKTQIFPAKDTSIELKIQSLLTELHIEFFTHKYISEITHGYQCDILIPVQKGINQKTIIECDGDYWHGNKNIYEDIKLTERIIKQRELDNIRNYELSSKGFKVLRLWEHEIKDMKLKDFKEKLLC